jgi:predicted negative regulator of RcsB-dependent stress response
MAAPVKLRLKKLKSNAAKLRRKTQELRIQFADTDLNAGLIMIRLARLDFATGHFDHATRLLTKAQEAADTVGDLIASLSNKTPQAVSRKFEALITAIEETRMESAHVS